MFVEMLGDLRYYSRYKRGFTVATTHLTNEELASIAKAIGVFKQTYDGRIIIKTTMMDGAVNYISVNPETINALEDITNEEYLHPKDSIDGFGYGLDRNMKLKIIFDQNHIEDPDEDEYYEDRRSGKFFPFYNRSEFDLELYDIYKNDIKNDSCLLTAIENSKVLTDNELNLLKSSIHTRCVTVKELKNICELLDIKIKLFYIIFDEKHTNKPSAMKPDANWLSKLGCSDKIQYFGSKDANKSINLIIMIWNKYKIAH